MAAATPLSRRPLRNLMPQAQSETRPATTSPGSAPDQPRPRREPSATTWRPRPRQAALSAHSACASARGASLPLPNQKAPPARIANPRGARGRGCGHGGAERRAGAGAGGAVAARGGPAGLSGRAGSRGRPGDRGETGVEEEGREKRPAAPQGPVCWQRPVPGAVRGGQWARYRPLRTGDVLCPPGGQGRTATVRSGCAVLRSSAAQVGPR